MNARSSGALKGWQTRRETDDRVVSEIAPEHQALWNRAKRGILGTPHERAEQLEQYAHDHPGEAIEALQEQADATLEWLLAAREANDVAVAEEEAPARKCGWRRTSKGLVRA